MHFGLRISPEARLLAELYEEKLASGTLPKFDAPVKTGAAIDNQVVNTTPKETSNQIPAIEEKVAVNQALPHTPVIKEASDKNREKPKKKPTEITKTRAPGAPRKKVTEPIITVSETENPITHYPILGIKDKEGRIAWWLSESQRKSSLNLIPKANDWKHLRLCLQRLGVIPGGGYAMDKINRILPCSEKPEGCNCIIVSTDTMEFLKQIEAPGIFTTF